MKKTEKDEKGKGVRDGPPPVKRVPKIDLSPLAADAPDPASTGEVQSALMDPETKKVFELLIVEIRRQAGSGTPGNGGPGTGGVSQADFDAFKAAVVNDLNSLRDKIMLMNASLDADTGVATTTFAASCDPPPITAA
jgi:hypothetical protein